MWQTTHPEDGNSHSTYAPPSLQPTLQTSAKSPLTTGIALLFLHPITTGSCLDAF